MVLPESKENNFFGTLGDEFLAAIHEQASRMAYTHVHSVYELYFCPTSIAHRCVICGKEYEFSHPSVILSKPYTIHSMAVTDPWPKGKKWYVFSFSESTASKSGMDKFLSEMFANKLGLLFSLTPDQAQYLENILQFLFDPAHPLEERDALSIFSFFLCRLHSLPADDQIIGIGNADYGAQLVMQHICENFHSSLTTEDLARKFSVSRSKLDRDFKNAIGVTPKDFTELCRLHCAKRLLVSKEIIKISQVAQLCGFPSENYFYRFFRQHTGMTPTQYKSAATRNRHV